MVKAQIVQKPKKTIDPSLRTVFLSGISYQATQQEVSQFLSECGKIQKINLPKYQDTGRCLGYAHVTFTLRKNAKKALDLDKKQLLGRYVNVSMAKKPLIHKQQQKTTVPQGCKTIFVGNLPYECTEDQVGQFFNSCGKIKGIRFAFNSVLKHFKGFGYIDFQFNDSVSKALALNGQQFKGRKLRIDAQVGSQKKGYHNFPVANTKFGTD